MRSSGEAGGQEIRGEGEEMTTHINMEYWRRGTHCDWERYTEYFDKSRNKVRSKWNKYNYVKCSVCGGKKLKLEKTIKKHEKNYCSNQCRAEAINKFYSGENHMSYKSGKYIHEGYVLVKKPEHYRADKNGYVKEHVLLAEEKIGRKLLDNEEVHHINKIKNDNRYQNLAVLTISEHRTVHARRKRKVRYDYAYCSSLRRQG